MPSPNSQVTPANRARTVTVSGPAEAVASGTDGPAPASQNQEEMPVRPTPGLMPNVSAGQGWCELACSASAISGEFGGGRLSVGFATQTIPRELPWES